MTAAEPSAALPEAGSDSSQATEMPRISLTVDAPEGGALEAESSPSPTPLKPPQEPVAKEPAATPRLRKKVPWKGKNILISLPRDDHRGQTGNHPPPLRPDEIDRMFTSWKERGYDVDGFDLVKASLRSGADDSQSRRGWPDPAELSRERSERNYKVTLPDLNGALPTPLDRRGKANATAAWKNYVNELQEAKLRALGVSFASEEPEEPSISPPITNPSRQPSAQYPSHPFSPPVPTSSASSSQAMPGYPFPAQFVPANHSPGQPAGASPVPFGVKFHPRQSISLPAGSPGFPMSAQSPGWPAQAGLLQGINRLDSPSLVNLNGVLSPQPPYGLDGLPQAVSPVFNMHQRHQSMQYMPPQMGARASPRLQDVCEEDELANHSPSKTPEPIQQNPESLQAEIDDAEYHLEEQLRNQLEHEDYNPQNQAENPAAGAKLPAPMHSRDTSGSFGMAERFAHEPGKPLVLHHPRPHSRGHSLSQNFFRDHNGGQESASQGGLGQPSSLNDIPETQKGDEAYEIETNPSNLGTPVRGFEFAAALGQHQKTLSNTSNPWHGNDSGASTRRSSHGSKPSLSKLNVQAPEFKFNPTSTFTPNLFNFSGNNFQPAAFQANTNAMEAHPVAVSQLQGPGRFHATAPPFSPGQSEFSFSMSGPKFRPDAPSFTPFQSLPGSMTSPIGSGSESAGKNSIFGKINIQASEIVKPSKASRAIPIVRPSSKSSAKSVHVSDPNGEVHEDDDGRVANDESRVKRARSEAPDGSHVPLFAERPGRIAGAPCAGAVDSHSVEEASAIVDRDHALPVDTSLSSIASDRMDTNATTAASSDMSPIGDDANHWLPFEFDSKLEAKTFSESRNFAEDGFMRPQHKKSLSATAKPFVPTGMAPVEQSEGEAAEPDNATPPLPRRTITPKGLAASRFAPRPPSIGLAGSRFAKEAPPADERHNPVPDEEVLRSIEDKDADAPIERLVHVGDKEPTFEEIDAVMQHLGSDPSMGVNKSIGEVPHWQRGDTAETEIDFQSDGFQLHVEQFARDGTSITPRQYRVPDSPPMPSTELEDPFVDPPLSCISAEFDPPPIDSEVASEWEAAFSEDEHEKLESRAQFFDGRVNEVVGSLLASRLEPLERSLSAIQHALLVKPRRAPSSRRDMRSISFELQESDADDEDDDAPALRRSASPRKDRRVDFIKAAVVEALGSLESRQLFMQTDSAQEDPAMIKSLEEMKHQFVAPLSARAGEQTVEGREPFVSTTEVVLQARVTELQAKLAEAEELLQARHLLVEKEVADRRAAQDVAAELHRKLQAAETRVEVEIINRSVFDQRVTDLEERLRQQENKNDEEIKTRQAAEDRLSEVQRLLRISSEEETRLRETLDERGQLIRSLEQEAGQNTMRMAMLDAAQANSTQCQNELTSKITTLEADLRNVRQDNNHWRTEAERADEVARRKSGELGHVLEENRHMRKSLNTLVAQLEENERLRESWRIKFMSLQDDMARATRDIAEEGARRIRKEQTMLARQEVLDARLQAEAKTRERLEVEMERLQDNERSGMRAVNECKRLESLLGELRTENHKLQQTSSRYQREFSEARESGASEVKRTRLALQTEVDAANNQVNVIREELEEQNSKLRADLDNFRLEADTAKAQNEMLLEEAQTTKATEIEELRRKHENEVEDMQARYERQVSSAAEEAQRTEQHLLERLSLSSSKIEHLQDRVVHLEDKLEIARAAAAAAAQAAKSAGVDPGAAATTVVAGPKAAEKSDLPEKISPQALRESIMVLQEQLQAREQRIEELEQDLAKCDPDAATKISKRDDEITWLRELLSVRHSDLQDIITALSGDAYSREAVKDAAIRLKANLQMEEQERERALNGGSAISLPSIAQSIQAATPRVAQAVGPIAAAWGSWRKASQPSLRSISAALNSPAGNHRTPSKSRAGPSPKNSLLSGLLTPPASGIRQAPPVDAEPQPTAFASTGRRYTPQSSGAGRARGESTASRRSDMVLAAVQQTPPRALELRAQPQTPPMMHQGGYDSDAQPGDFDDHDFFEED